ncbi:hypothetical protein [Wolbachia endosymbiont of Nomada ferruginata]|uniref:hypothetical protein n=1 Tax=Wolbachia endosymbiont of Nomada ferruginata TaxID=1854761 RepID=UPI0012E7A740|nr:hypothetical protein [Wolbachia endosymbiont of Nomada ferruginata]
MDNSAPSFLISARVVRKSAPVCVEKPGLAPPKEKPNTVGIQCANAAAPNIPQAPSLVEVA